MHSAAGEDDDAAPTTVLRRIVRTLTMPLPSHIADFREPARTALIFVALTVGLGALALPQEGPVEVLGVLLLSSTVAVVGVASLFPRFHNILNRVGGLLLLCQIAALVYLTGGAASIYSPLYILLLLYAAIFYGTARLLATTIVVIGALLLPIAYGVPDAFYGSRVLLQATAWAVAAATVHWLVARMRMSAQTDGLTGLWNHVTFWQLLRTSHERHERAESAYSVLLIDLDHFKKVNDRLGHRAGDEVLRSVSALLQARCRRSDIVARYGGEEFAILLPDTDRATAIEVAKELRMRVLTTTLLTPVTVSVGVACNRDFAACTGEGIVAAADRALYAAKEAGRNHVAVSLPETVVHG